MLTQASVIPDEVGYQGLEGRAHGNGQQDDPAIHKDQGADDGVRVYAAAGFLRRSYGAKRADNSTHCEDHHEEHDCGEQHQVDQVELTGPRMEGEPCLPEPAVVVLPGLETLMCKRREYVQREYCQYGVQQEYAVGSAET